MRFIFFIYYFLKKKILLFDFFKNITVKYNFGNISILLPLNHRLPEFQFMNPKYDKFLPVICQQIKTDETIIDIAANVGDTLASLVEKNSKPTFLCIEANNEFFSYLKINIKRIKKKIKDINIFASKQLVGKNINNVLLKRKEGTARAIIDKGNLKPKPLDEILIDFNNHKNIDNQKSQLKERKHVATGSIIAEFIISLLSLRMNNETMFLSIKAVWNTATTYSITLS